MKKESRLNNFNNNNRAFGYIPYLIFGLFVFIFNSQLNFNYFIKGYISVLELQAGIILIYFLSLKFKRSKIKPLK